MLLLPLLLSTASYLTVTALGVPQCSSGVQSSTDITIFADIFVYLGNTDGYHIIQKIVETLNGSSSDIKIVLNCYSKKRLEEYIENNQALGAIPYSVTEDATYEYINSMEWKPPSSTERKSNILILILRDMYPVVYMKPKITKLKRAGLEIFTLLYDSVKDHELDEVASYPAEWHSYSRLKFHSSDSAADSLVRSVCRSIESKERIAKKQLLSEVRLAGGNGPCQGRVEVFYNGTWGFLSDRHWDRRAADVFCRQLKCGPSVDALKGDAFGAGTGHVLEKVDCTGDESDVSQCLLGVWTESSQQSAGVTCLSSGVSGVRLVNGSGTCDGVVEVSLNNIWSRLSLWNFDLREGAVICRQMGCGPLVKIQELITDSEIQTVQRSRCLGTESQFSECRTSLWTSEPVLQTLHASVVCLETAFSNVILVGGRDSCSGKVKILYNDLWTSVCAAEWSATEEAVLCKQMGCGPALELVEVKKVSLSKTSTHPTNFRDVHCGGHETRLSQCSTILSRGYGCEFGEAEALCANSAVMKLRLVDGEHRCAGRVEVLYKKKWGTVCDEHWDLLDAEVVCRQLGCGAALQALGGAYFGLGSGDIWLEKVFCIGTESALSQCGSVVSRRTLCVHSQDASVICEDKELV